MAFIICEMMGRIFWRIYIQPLHRIAIGMIILVILWATIMNLADKSLWWRLFNAAVFLGIVAVILYMTVYTRGENPQVPVLMPFHSFMEAKIQPELYRSMLMNIFLFEPIGLSLPNILPKKAHPVAVTVAVALFLSLGIEASQFYFHLGRCETDDVIMNTLGATIGAAAYGLVKRHTGGDGQHHGSGF